MLSGSVGGGQIRDSSSGWVFLGITEGLCNWFPATFGVDIFRSRWGTLKPNIIEKGGVDLS